MNFEDLDQRLEHMENTMAELAADMKKLAASDRRQWAKIEVQRRYMLIFFGVVGLGALLGFGSLQAEDRETLERVAVAVIVAGGAGMVGANSSQFSPPGIDEDEN